MPEKPEHVFLIDGSGFLFRAYYGIKQRLTNTDGVMVNAVYGFSTMLMKLIEDTDADHVAVIFDAARKTFRNEIYSEYKAHRPPPPDDLIPQFDLVRDATRAFNVACVDMPGFEADDLIATYARQAREAGADVTVVSSDKDLMQLVGDGVIMFDAMKNKEIGPDQVVEKFGVGPDKVIEVQALAGDASDNVPGVPGIGIKTAAQLINEYGDLENLLAHADEIKQNKRRENLIEFADDARVSKVLVTLKDDVPVETPLTDFAVQNIDEGILLEFLKKQSFKSIISRIESRNGHAMNDGTTTNSPPAAPPPPPVGEATYELVQDMGALKSWIKEAREKGVVAVDTETTSLDALQANLVGVSLSLQPGRACYIPLAHTSPAEQGTFDLGGDGDGEDGGEAPEQVDFDAALVELKDLLEDPSVLKVGHNIKYDIQVLANHGITVAPVDDTMVLSYVLEGGMHGHGLDELALMHFDHTNIKFKEVAGTGKSQVTFDKVGLSDALDYAAEDADYTGRLHQALKPRLVTDSMVTVYETLERQLIPVLVDMERHGIKVDAKELNRLSDDFGKRLNALEAEIHELAGHEFNVGSPKQLGEVLFDEMGIEGGKKGKTGAYKTGAEVLEELAADGHDLPARVLDWRQLAKLKSTYTDALIAQINPDTKRVHTSYSMAATSTGRLASSDPNLQNIPIRTEEGRKIRRAFIAEAGHVLLSADYSQIELRLLAHVAGIDVLIDAFKAGDDIHAMTASQVFGVPVEGMDPMIRRQAKAINFGIIYGISAFGLARQLGISRPEAAEYIDAYFERYPGIRDYMEETKQQAHDHGYVTTLFGRKCHTPGIGDKNSARKNFAERAAINAPIQGGAADIIKRAMIAMPNALTSAGLATRMLLQVHDELVFEVPKKEIDAASDVIRTVMEGAAHLDVPLTVDIGQGDNWDDAH
ncbi:MAG: DNA polymerase I [Rhodospirillaceae bacterium]|nr:DNA polymerase I [Rhodospirillaceae bacterium]MBT4463366.1 DNA polymerase I [Rhodospirillaceae bacterium]MBT5308379.1 DNA polymerase I [Rhodospirillaceae bacterium]MBT7355909.1 DNA polymerase I [Rhodospirillaceae bacterium]